MKNLFRYLRIDEWISSKVTMMLGVAAYFICLGNVGIYDAAKILGTYFLFLSMLAAISYVANDFSDMEADMKVGKKKVIASLPRPVIWLSFVIMALIGDIPIMLCAENKLLCAALIIVTTFMGVAYSIPGIRFKERGVLGLIQCSVAQHCLPLTPLFLFFGFDGTNAFVWIIWFVLSFFDGLRYILIHQYTDRENDRLSGTHTFVADGRVNIRRFVIALAISEGICCLLLMIPLFAAHKAIILAGVIFNIALEFCIWMVLNVYAKKDWIVSFDSVPLEAFLNAIMPFMFGLCMMKINRWAGLFSLFILICCYSMMKIKLGIAAVFVKSKLSREKQKGAEDL